MFEDATKSQDKYANTMIFLARWTYLRINKKHPQLKNQIRIPKHTSGNVEMEVHKPPVATEDTNDVAFLSKHNQIKRLIIAILAAFTEEQRHTLMCCLASYTRLESEAVVVNAAIRSCEKKLEEKHGAEDTYLHCAGEERIEFGNRKKKWYSLPPKFTNAESELLKQDTDDVDTGIELHMVYRMTFVFEAALIRQYEDETHSSQLLVN